MTTPRRRWFRFAFSLRTLFVVVTIFGVWLGWLVWQMQIVRDRRLVMAYLDEIRIDKTPPSAGGPMEALESMPYWNDVLSSNLHVRVSAVRRYLGDESYLFINMPASIEGNLLERAERAFPEAELHVLDARGKEVAYRDSLYAPAKRRQPNKGTIFKTGLIEK